MAEESIINKIRKLLSLSQSSNPHEAAIALSKANELMEQHQIESIDLLVKSDISHSDIGEVTGQHFVWSIKLANACANLFDCSIIIYRDIKGFRFVGTSENIACAIQLFWHLFKAWKGMCAADYKIAKPHNRQLYRKSHGLGFASMIWTRVSELTEKRHNNIVKSTGTDLVIVNAAKIDEYMKINFINLKYSKSRSLTADSSGFTQGLIAGKKVNLMAPIEEDNRRLV